MRIGIMGAGAIGNYCAALLTAAGHEVILFARGKTLEAIQEKGIILSTPDIAAHIYHVEVAAAADAANYTDIDIVLLATKVLPNAEAFPELPKGAAVVTIQNSVEAPYLAAEKYGEELILPGTFRGFLTNLGPGQVHLHDPSVALNFGTFKPGPNKLDPLCAEFSAALNSVNISTQVLADPWPDVWAKALFVTPLGALGAAARRPLGYVRTTLRDSYISVLSEVAAVARAHQVSLSSGLIEKQLAFADSLPEENTTSMHRDILLGQANELDAQVGAIIRMGEKVQVRTPLLRLLLGILTATAADAAMSARVNHN
ncbi:2-dehydropantoate 2-reductase [Corynebacterium caspium]|uniref:2-dehydropantoate 2-reductase n=1 Tax=Corynebacterium caspium TaxID=234828 RepID=UPI000370A0B9|nr:2-dehydropantoate 2-reductase [Corynebacterium caspium]WKD59653.1 2-dehydropantoate 2-reductase [Corynebacterium caspium DSM 44850]